MIVTIANLLMTIGLGLILVAVIAYVIRNW
jgi:hypothetical protein